MTTVKKTYYTASCSVHYPATMGLVFKEGTQDALNASILKAIMMVQATADRLNGHDNPKFHKALGSLAALLVPQIEFSETQDAESIVEAVIIHKALTALNNAGYTLHLVNDYGNYSAALGVKETLAGVLGEDELAQQVIVQNLGMAVSSSFILFVKGNGASVISDYGLSIETALHPVMQFIDLVEEC